MFKSTLPETAQTALAVLGKSGLVAKAYLAGGSALALHFGHRKSYDFDFFSRESFDPQKLSKKLQKAGDFTQELAKGISLIGTFNGVKFSYFQYEYPLIAPLVKFLNVTIADPRDIAAMKLTAIMDRGTKRDFIDLYEMTKQGMPVEALFDYYDQKYHFLNTNRFSLIKALQYFDEADESDMPQMIKKIGWSEVKAFFASESIRLAHKYL